MLKKITALFSFCVCLLTALTCNISPVSAIEAGDIVVQIHPSEQEIVLSPGETIDYALSVKNIGRLGFNFTVSAHPYQVTEDYDPDFVTTTNYTKLQNWINFSETNFYLDPGAEIDVAFQITVPDDAPAGGQYAAIIVETRDSIDESSMFHTVGQLASIIYAEVSGDTRIEGSLISHHLPSVLFGQPVFSDVTVENTGNIDFRLSQQLIVSDFFTGNEVFNSQDGLDFDSDINPNPRVMPGSTRTNIVTWEGSPQLGIFKTVQNISFLDQNYTYEQIVVLCPIWLVGGVVFLVVLAIVWLILRIRSRKRRRPQNF